MRQLMVYVLTFSIIYFIQGIDLFAGEIKPGVIINKDNYEEYLPELKKLLFPACQITYLKGIKSGWTTIRVIEPRTYPVTKQGKATMANAGKFRVGENNLLIGDWKQGSPFPNPKTGAELAWSTYRHRSYRDHDRWPAHFFLFHKDGTLEREFKWLELKRHYTGRVYIPPIPEEPGNNGVIESKEAQVIYEPYDVRGFILLRIRYEDLHKDDDVYAHIPAIRRIRRMSGSDVTDPLIGSDLVMDDYEMWRQKITTKMTFKMSEGEFLWPRLYPADEKAPWDPKKNKYCVEFEWEKQTYWILEVYPNEPDYVYSKRVIYVMKDGTFRPAGSEMYDQKGRMMRAHSGMFFTLQKGTNDLENFSYYILENSLTGHHTFADVGDYSTDCPKNIFSIKRLLKFAR